MPVSVGQALFLEQLPSTPPQPSHLLATPLGQPTVPTCSQVPLLYLSGCCALLWLPLCPAVWHEGLLTTPRVYFSFRLAGHTQQASEAHAKLCFFIWFF